MPFSRRENSNPFHFPLASWTWWQRLNHGFTLLYLKLVSKMLFLTCRASKCPSHSTLRIGGLVTPNLNYMGFISNFLPFIGLRGSGTTLNIELEPLMESGGSSPIVNLYGIERFLDYVEHRTWTSNGIGRSVSHSFKLHELRSSWRTFDIELELPMS